MPRARSTAAAGPPAGAGPVATVPAIAVPMLEATTAEAIAQFGLYYAVDDRAYGVFRRYPQEVAAQCDARWKRVGDCRVWTTAAGIVAFGQWIPIQPAALCRAVDGGPVVPPWIMLTTTCGRDDCVHPAHQREVIDQETNDFHLGWQDFSDQYAAELERDIQQGKLATLPLLHRAGRGILRADLTAWWRERGLDLEAKLSAGWLRPPPPLDTVADPATDPLPGAVVQLFQRGLFGSQSPWTFYLRLNKWNRPDTVLDVLRSTVVDGEDCTQFTLIPADDTVEYALVQVQIFKNTRTRTYAYVPCEVAVNPRKRTITIELLCRLLVDGAGELVVEQRTDYEEGEAV